MSAQLPIPLSHTHSLCHKPKCFHLSLLLITILPLSPTGMHETQHITQHVHLLPQLSHYHMQSGLMDNPFNQLANFH